MGHVPRKAHRVMTTVDAAKESYIAGHMELDEFESHVEWLLSVGAADSAYIYIHPSRSKQRYT